MIASKIVREPFITEDGDVTAVCIELNVACFLEAKKQQTVRIGPKEEPKQLPTHTVRVLVNYVWNCVASINIYNTLPQSVVLYVNDKWSIYVRYVMILYE